VAQAPGAVVADRASAGMLAAPHSAAGGGGVPLLRVDLSSGGPGGSGNGHRETTTYTTFHVPPALSVNCPEVLSLGACTPRSEASGSESCTRSRRCRGARGAQGGVAGVVRRSNAWLAQRELKREMFREEHLAKVFPFKPRVLRSRGVPRVCSGGGGGRGAPGSVFSPAHGTGVATVVDSASSGHVPPPEPPMSMPLPSRWCADIDLRPENALSSASLPTERRMATVGGGKGGMADLGEGASSGALASTVVEADKSPVAPPSEGGGARGATLRRRCVGTEPPLRLEGCTSGPHRTRSSGAAGIAERSEAWLAYREQKRAVLRQKCASGIGPFVPRLWRPERSPRWLAGPEGGGDLHERGMRAIERRDCQQRRREEERLAEDVQKCSFAPDISETWPPPAQLPLGLGSLPPPCQPMRSRPENCMTPERATEFYEQQIAWREACLEMSRHQRVLDTEGPRRSASSGRQEERYPGALSEEAHARVRSLTPRRVYSRSIRSVADPNLAGTHTAPQVRAVSSPAVRAACATASDRTGGGCGGGSGALARAVYDRQVLWRRQRDSDIEELRRVQREGPRRRQHRHLDASLRSALSSSLLARPLRRCRSAPSTPRGRQQAPATDSTGVASETSAGRPMKRSSSSLATTSIASRSPRMFPHCRATHLGGSADASTTPGRSRSLPATPRGVHRTRTCTSTTPQASVTPLRTPEPESSGALLVEKLRSMRLQHGQGGCGQGGGSAPSTPRGHRQSCTPAVSGSISPVRRSPTPPQSLQSLAPSLTMLGGEEPTRGGSARSIAVPPPMAGVALTAPTPFRGPFEKNTCGVHWGRSAADGPALQVAREREEVDELLQVLTGGSV